MSKREPSQAWWAKAQLYRRFSSEERYGHLLDFSETAARAMYAYETFGEGENPYGIFREGKQNGYALGKKWWDWQVAAWKEGLAFGFISKHELFGDTTLPQEAVRAALADAPVGTFVLFREREDEK